LPINAVCGRGKRLGPGKTHFWVSRSRSDQIVGGFKGVSLLPKGKRQRDYGIAWDGPLSILIDETRTIDPVKKALHILIWTVYTRCSNVEQGKR